MIDWYDMQACHTGNPANHDRSNGRIYKIVYKAGRSEANRAKTTVDLAKLNDLQLAELVLHKNDWYVRHSRKSLQHRAASGKIDRQGDRSAGQDRRIARRRNAPPARSWALHVTGGLTRRTHRSDCWPTRAPMFAVGPFKRAWNQAKGNSPKRAELAQRWPKTTRRQSFVCISRRRRRRSRRPIGWSMVEALTAHREDASDHNLPLMYWYAAEPLAEVDGRRAIALAAQGRGGDANATRVHAASDRRQAMAQRPSRSCWKGSKRANSADSATNISRCTAGRRPRATAHPAPTGWKTAYAKLSQSSDPVCAAKRTLWESRLAIPKRRQVDARSPPAHEAKPSIVAGRSRPCWPPRPGSAGRAARLARPFGVAGHRACRALAQYAAP